MKMPMIKLFYRYPKVFLLIVLLSSCSVLLRVLYYSVHMIPRVLNATNSLHHALEMEHATPSSLVMLANMWSEQTPVNCKLIIQGDKKEVSQANKVMKNFPKKGKSPEDYIELTKDCDTFKTNRGYILRALNNKEKEFPIAYSITIYRDIEQFERLLRAIYRPQNYYCIHIDKKSPKTYHRAAESISGCFSNVILASKYFNVRWGEISVLHAYLICMKDLWMHYKDWKYFINLTGQEFPLKTNNELVKILKRYGGRSLVTGKIPRDRMNIRRTKFVYDGTKRTRERKVPFAQNFTYFKGSTFVALTRSFADFALHSKVATEFLEWLKDTKIADETFLPSLYGNFPDGPRPPHGSKKLRAKQIRYVNWGDVKCHGKKVHGVCVHGVGDLKFLTSRSEFFVNKFHLEYQYLALDCLEQWFYNKTFAFYERKLQKKKTNNI